MWTGHLGLVRGRLTDSENVLDLAKKVRHGAIDGLTHDQEVGCFRRVLEDRGAEEVVVDDLGNFALVNVTE
jgi:hypothetical protein